MKIKLKTGLIIFASLLFVCCSKPFKEKKELTLNSANAIFEKNILSVNTGNISRTWEVRRNGLIIASENEKNKSEELYAWSISGIKGESKVTSYDIRVSSDEGFTSKHLEATVDFDYPSDSLSVRYKVWVYPNAPGLRTQLFMKYYGKNSCKIPIENSTTEQQYIPASTKKVICVGYNNDTQHRNMRHTPIMKMKDFKIKDSESINKWANLIITSSGDEGIILVKESHKCVNQKGVYTGGFTFSNNRISNFGAALDSKHITNKYQPCWATWTIKYKGNLDDAKLALKEFDRLRYPIDPSKDIYIMSNTWGSGTCGDNSKYSARESNVLKEIASAKDLGIDLLQIDDGWQGTKYKDWKPVKSAVYNNGKKVKPLLLKNGTEYKVYPEGWKNIKSSAKESGVKLGLWAAAWIPYQDLLNNYKTGGFTSYKLDFSRLKDYKTLSEFVGKVRSFVKATGNNVRVNWDVTENPPRIGYYFGREYGNIYLANRKPEQPENVIYKPWLVLRDAWHVAQYTNLNKFQITYQNVDIVNREFSDAYKHNHDYCLAITLMGSPIFFQETQYLNSRARKQIKPLIKTYKSIRSELYKGYTYAIGDEPDNSSWTGFQNHNSNTNCGYLTIFREIKNTDKSQKIDLKFLNGKNVEFTDLKNNKRFTINNFNTLKLEIDKPAGYKFLKYKIK